MAMHDLKVYLVEDAKVSLEDEFVDKEDDLRHFVYETIKGLAKQAKMIVLNGQFVANVADEDKPGQSKQETIKLKEYDIEKHTVKSDPDWLPENLEEGEAETYKIRVGDKTQKLLETYYQIYQARVELYNKSVDRTAKGFDEDKLAKLAKCQEQIIHEALIGPVMDKIQKSIDKELEEEFEDVYKGKKDKAAEKKKSRSKK